MARDLKSVKRDPNERRPRVLLTDQAVFHRDMIHESINLLDGEHHRLTIGDLVMLNDEEFERHRAGGIALVNPEEVREAAE